MKKLDKRVAIVTGGGTGLGRSIALTFAREGADVVISSRNLASLEKVSREINALGTRSLPVVTNVSVAGQVRDMVKQTVDHFGRIDILVNSAGVLLKALIIDISEGDWDTVMDTNLKGAFLSIQAVARHMIEQRYGKIINISAIAGIRANYPENAAYGVSKAGLILLTKSAALELGPHGINVNCIAPGPVDTGFRGTAETPEQVQQWLDTSRKRSIVGRVGTPQDVANLALFLASDDSSFICGETIIIDGGRICQGFLGGG